MSLLYLRLQNSFLCITFSIVLILFFPVTTLSQQFSCYSFFSKSQSFKMVDSSPGEENYYLTDFKRRFEYQVYFNSNLKFSYVDDHSTFTSHSSTFTIDNQQKQINHSMIIVDTNGSIYIDKTQIVGKRHHSTVVAGESVLFAGIIQTNLDGILQFINYTSGHYKPSPWALKWFIDYTGGPMNYANVFTTFSDVESERELAMDPTILISDFYNSIHNQNENGNHGLIRYIVNTHRSQQIQNANLISQVKPIATQILRLLFHPRILNSTLKTLPDISFQEFSEAAFKWIQIFYEKNPALASETMEIFYSRFLIKIGDPVSKKSIDGKNYEMTSEQMHFYQFLLSYILKSNQD